MEAELISELSSKGYWPAVARDYFREEKYDKVLELCRRRLPENPKLISGRLIYALALYRSGEIEKAETEFYNILRVDSENLAALKCLGDIKFASGETDTAVSFYERVLAIEPYCTGLSDAINEKERIKGQAIILKRGGEILDADLDQDDSPGDLPFRTETMGDLLLSQGHARLALDIFEDLAGRTGESRFEEKAEHARTLLKKKEK